MKKKILPFSHNCAAQSKFIHKYNNKFFEGGCLICINIYDRKYRSCGPGFDSSQQIDSHMIKNIDDFE